MSEAFVSTIINNAISTANSATSSASSAAREASTASQGYALVNPPPVEFDITAVEPAIPDVGDPTLTYESQRDQIIALLSDKLSNFFVEYYPLQDDAYDAATAWLLNEITIGGTGLSPSVEAQLWQRARDRVVADGLRAENQTRNEFASRGFSLPPGAMAARLQRERFDQTGKLQEHSRDVAIKQAEMMIENLRFAVDLAIKARLQAIQAAADYIRALMAGPELAARVATLYADAKARMMGATADLYRARLSRDEIAMKVPLVNSDINVRSQMSNLEGFYRGVDARVAAAGHAADVYGRTAQAALASLSSVASSSNSSFA